MSTVSRGRGASRRTGRSPPTKGSRGGYGGGKGCSRDETKTRRKQTEDVRQGDRQLEENKSVTPSNSRAASEGQGDSIAAIAPEPPHSSIQSMAETLTDPLVPIETATSGVDNCNPTEKKNKAGPRRSPRGSKGKGKLIVSDRDIDGNSQTEPSRKILDNPQSGSQETRKRTLSSGTNHHDVKKQRVEKKQSKDVTNERRNRDWDDAGAEITVREDRRTRKEQDSTSGRRDGNLLSGIGKDASATLQEVIKLNVLASNNANEIKEMKNMIVQLSQTIDNMKNMQCDRNMGKVSAPGAKRQFEEFMMKRLSMMQDVFAAGELLRSTSDVMVRTILKARQGSTLPIRKVKELFDIFGYAQLKNKKAGSSGSELEGKVSVFRRMVLVNCIRRAFDNAEEAIATGGDNVLTPFWLAMVKRGDSNEEETYFGELHMEAGFVRREEKRNDEEAAVRRRKIADGTVIPTYEDDGEFVGWWSYGALMAMLTRMRKVAIASLFEVVIYLLVPWVCVLGDKEVIFVDEEDAEIPTIKDKAFENVLRSISSKSVKACWGAGRQHNVKDLFDIPSAVTAADVSEESANATNQEIYRKFATERTELQINIRHDVAVFVPVKGCGRRQKKGTEVRTISRTITLLDAASQYMSVLAGGERALSATDMMKFNKSSLIGIYLLALGIRDMIEGARPGAIGKSDDETTQHDSNELFEDNAIADCKALFDSLIPNYQLQGRALNRCVWGVSKEMFDAHNMPNKFQRKGDVRRNYASSASMLLDETDDLLVEDGMNKRDRNHNSTNVNVNRRHDMHSDGEARSRDRSTDVEHKRRSSTGNVRGDRKRSHVEEQRRSHSANGRGVRGKGGRNSQSWNGRGDRQDSMRQEGMGMDDSEDDDDDEFVADPEEYIDDSEPEESEMDDDEYE